MTSSTARVTEWFRNFTSRTTPIMTRVRRVLLPIALLIALAYFASKVHQHDNIQRWLVWRYLLYWLLSAVWALSCFSFGHFAIKRVLRAPLPIVEHVTMSLAAGVIAFFMVMFVGGLFMAYGPVFFVLAPTLLLGIGARDTYRYLRRLRRGVLAVRRRTPRPHHAGNVALWCLGLLALFLYYLPAIVPSHIGYDSAWYHVPIAEHYASQGGIKPFVEGWYAGAISHLPSVMYTWAFLIPGGELFDFIELSAHMEFASCLMMLPGIVALVRRLVPGARAHVAWIAFFAFPAVYWYDIMIGGDQFSALWSAPIALGLLRVYPTLSWRYGVLLVIGIAGEALTKYSAMGILGFPPLAVAFRAVWLGGRAAIARRPLREVLNPTRNAAIIALLILILTSPHWLKNWVFYGDPLHPVLNAYFDSHPWTADAADHWDDYLAEMRELFQPPHTWRGALITLESTFSHSFSAADYSSQPLRGSLFTLLCLCLPVLRASARLWGMALFGHVAIFIWYWQMHPDRYLMAFMPLMAGVIASCVVLAWRSSRVAQVATVLLVGTHTLWGLGIFALSDPQRHYRDVINFVAQAAEQKTKAGMGSFAGWQQIGAAIPKGSKVIVHEVHLHTGLGHPSVSDWPRTQTGISYGRFESPAAMLEGLRRMGVTHIVWNHEHRSDDSVAGNLRFYEFVTKYTEPKAVAGMYVSALPKSAPGKTPSEPLVAFLGCEDKYEPGLYPLSAMTRPNPRGNAYPPYPKPIRPYREPGDADALANEAQYVVYGAKCNLARPHNLKQDFIDVGRRGANRLYARK